MAAIAKPTATLSESLDRTKDVKQFEDSKIGVKGLVDSGNNTIPNFFIHSAETIDEIRKFKFNSKPVNDDIIPIIDISGAESEQLRPAIVEKIARASREVGFFQIVNHGIEVDVMDRLIEVLRAVHELPDEEKEKIYDPKRDWTRGVSLFSNLDIYHSGAASWRDTFYVKFAPNPPKPEEFPDVCRKEVMEWDLHMKKIGELLMELLCEGLGLASGRMKEMTFLDGRRLIGNYYPYCPQPDLTVGIPCHTDPGALAILLQDHIGALQCRHRGEWVDVKPVPGGLVVNIGDLFQIMSNDEYVSVDHRALANSAKEARVSAVMFFGSGEMERELGPIPELVTPEKPARFRQFSHADYMKRFQTKELDEKTLVNYYRV